MPWQFKAFYIISLIGGSLWILLWYFHNAQNCGILYFGFLLHRRATHVNPVIGHAPFRGHIVHELQAHWKKKWNVPYMMSRPDGAGNSSVRSWKTRNENRLVASRSSVWHITKCFAHRARCDISVGSETFAKLCWWDRIPCWGNAQTRL